MRGPPESPVHVVSLPGWFISRIFCLIELVKDKIVPKPVGPRKVQTIFSVIWKDKVEHDGRPDSQAVSPECQQDQGWPRNWCLGQCSAPHIAVCKSIRWANWELLWWRSSCQYWSCPRLSRWCGGWCHVRDLSGRAPLSIWPQPAATPTWQIGKIFFSLQNHFPSFLPKQGVKSQKQKIS